MALRERISTYIQGNPIDLWNELKPFLKKCLTFCKKDPNIEVELRKILYTVETDIKMNYNFTKRLVPIAKILTTDTYYIPYDVVSVPNVRQERHFIDNMKKKYKKEEEMLRQLGEKLTELINVRYTKEQYEEISENPNETGYNKFKLKDSKRVPNRHVSQEKLYGYKEDNDGRLK